MPLAAQSIPPDHTARPYRQTWRCHLPGGIFPALGLGKNTARPEYRQIGAWRYFFPMISDMCIPPAFHLPSGGRDRPYVWRCPYPGSGCPGGRCPVEISTASHMKGAGHGR